MSGKNIFLQNSGVYKITNTVTGDCYVGSTSNFKNRKNSHFWLLKTHKHGNRFLQHDYDRYGRDNFSFEVIIYCSKDRLIVNEQKAIDALRPSYNILKAERKGQKYPEMTRKLMSFAMRNNSKVKYYEDEKDDPNYWLQNPITTHTMIRLERPKKYQKRFSNR